MLSNKLIVITGAAGLIGESFCKKIVQNGGFVILADINKKNAEKISKILNVKEVKSCAYKVDITNKNSIDEFIKLVNSKHGKIDVLINNAYPRNSQYGRKVDKVTYESFCENINLHLGGYFLTTQIFAKYFKKNGGGKIINMASIYGTISPKFEIYNHTKMTTPIEYVAIKSALIAITKYFAKFYKNSKINFNTISPGGIYNNQDDKFIKNYNSFCSSKGMLDPDDLAGTLIFLVSDASAYINGQNIIVDDGFSL
jgi:NAD(P)-dependent dehydrogenase (short-subunit alcohol dehydrogenase family)